MAKDINKDIFPEETLQKLGIFAECFREWFPVFISNPYINEVYIFDFFAGSGKDAIDNLGSPLLLLKEARGNNCEYCNIANQNRKKVRLAFNENNEQKFTELKTNIKSFMEKCKKDNCKREKCIYLYENFVNNDFKDVFNDSSFLNILSDKNCAKFIILDQYGFSQIDENIFLKLVNSPYTDFIFFISSSYIKRFKDIDATKKYFNTSRIPFDVSNPKECHRLIADYYQQLIPQNKEYYTHHYTIKKGANYWGLIFGTNHSLGMEKFLRVCWKNDIYSGESNFNIDNDWPIDSLLFNGETSKIEKLKDDIRKKILSGEISDNKTGLKYALKNRCLPEVFVTVIEELNKNKQIKCIPKINRQKTNIHKVDLYQIEVLK